MATYTRSILKSDVNSRLHNKTGVLSNFDNSINRAVLEAWLEIDFRSSKRKATLSPDIETEVYEYTCPTDLKGYGIIDLQTQGTDDRSTSERWELTTEEQFDATKVGIGNLVAFATNGLTKTLLVAQVGRDTAVEYDIVYYSKYPWQDTSGTYLENSKADDDTLNIDSDEYNIILEKCIDKLGREAREYTDANDARVIYKDLKDAYTMRTPSEALILTTTYYDFGSINGDLI